MEALQGKTACSSPFMPKSTEMALPVLTKTFLQASPDMAMLFAPFGCTHPPSPVPPFLLSLLFALAHGTKVKLHNSWFCDIMKLKVSHHHMKSLGRKRLMRSLLYFSFKIVHGQGHFLLVKLMPFDTQWNQHLVVTHWASLVPRPRPAFCHLQYRKARRTWYHFSCEHDIFDK